MPPVPIRFLHAANLELDRPLRCGRPDAAAQREILEQAPMAAFRRLVGSAIEQQVDFVFVSGACFRTQTPSGPSLAALQQGVDELRAAGIPLLFPADALTHINPASAAGVYGYRTDGAPQIVEFDGRPLVRLMPCLSSETAPIHRVDSPHVDKLQPPVIGLAASELPEQSSGCDYIALTDSESRSVQHLGSTLVHAPGSIQARSDRHSGRCGATHIAIDAERRVDSRLVPTADVRWEHASIRLADQTDDELIDEMLLRLFDCEPPEAERLWIVEWDVAINAAGVATTPVSGLLDELSLRAEEELGVSVWNRARRQVVAGCKDDELMAEFLAILAEQAELGCHTGVGHTGDGHTGDGLPAELLPNNGADWSRCIETACELGRAWLGEDSRSESSKSRAA